MSIEIEVYCNEHKEQELSVQEVTTDRWGTVQAKVSPCEKCAEEAHDKEQDLEADIGTKEARIEELENELEDIKIRFEL
jgi:predicted RNase H-like nuclease (RuvC/YqgF family)